MVPGSLRLRWQGNDNHRNAAPRWGGPCRATLSPFWKATGMSMLWIKSRISSGSLGRLKASCCNTI
eukprot:2077075-Pyramimonas_sp.AAC.1